MNDQYAIRSHFASRITERDYVQSFSGLLAILRDARGATGRDPDSGAKLLGAEHVSWLGNLGYMVLTDQIGTCFDRIGQDSSDRNNFKRALALFGGLEDRDVKALYALRCCMAHDFSLCAYDTKGRPTYLFCLVGGTSAPLVSHAQQTWDGSFSGEREEMTTTVNLEHFGDHIETMVKTVRQLADDNQLRIRLRDGWHELLYRYSIGVRRRQLAQQGRSGDAGSRHA